MAVTAILTAAAIRAAEQALCDEGIAPYALMERAAAAAADIIWRVGGLSDTLVLCGPGNNGGDGYVIARLLRERGVPVRIGALGESRTDSSRTARAAWGTIVEVFDTASPATQVVDALFGTGLTRGLELHTAARLGELVSNARRSYAIDLPSGVDTDSGLLLSAPPRFDICIALGTHKPAHLLQPAAALCGRLLCVDLDMAADSAWTVLEPPDITAPDAHAHKYNRGLVAVIEGAMSSAAGLAARAAAHGGAGMVRYLGAGGAGLPDAVVRQDDPLTDALDDARIAAVLVGPGLGRDERAREKLEKALRCGKPLVLDADALALLGEHVPPWGSILTPHEGEFAAMFGTLRGNKIDRALAAAKKTRCVIVYKGADSVIAAPDGRISVARQATPWLSTAGTGDVLAGLCVARLAVTKDSFRAACEAVWLHGEAARRSGPAFIADDLTAHIPTAIAGRL